MYRCCSSARSLERTFPTSFSSCPSTLAIRDKRTDFSWRRCRLNVLAQDAGTHTEQRKDARCMRPRSGLIRDRCDSEPVASHCHAVDIPRKPITLAHDEVRIFCCCVIVKYRKAIRLFMGLCRQVNSPMRKSRRRIAGTYIVLPCRGGPSPEFTGQEPNFWCVQPLDRLWVRLLEGFPHTSLRKILPKVSAPTAVTLANTELFCLRRLTLAAMLLALLTRDPVC